MNPSNPAPVAESVRDRRREIRNSLEPVLSIKHAREGIRSSADLLSAVNEFASALSGLGPVFSHLARYLGSRPDCFQPEHCLTLGETGTPRLLSAAELRPYFADCFDETIPPWIDNLCEDPGRSDHLIHVYRWRSRPEITLRLPNPKFIDDWKMDDSLLELVVKPAEVIWPKAGLERLVRQFRDETERSLELEREFEWIKAHGPATKSLPVPGIGFALPRLAEEFCCRGIVATREPAGSLLVNPFRKKRPARSGMADSGRRDEEQNPGGMADAVPQEIALGRRFCLSILYHLIRGSWFPRSPSQENIGVTADEGLMLLGGSAGTLNRELQNRLFQYFAAVVSNRPDDAAAILLSLFETGRDAIEFEEVRDLFRQIVPFRDGGMGGLANNESFPEYVCIQWRIATESGYRAPTELVPAIQCFWRASAISRSIDPSRDLFREAYYEFGWIEALASIQEVMTVGNFVKQSRDWLNLMIEIPEKLNAAAKKQNPSAHRHHEPAPAPRSSASRWTVVAAHLFVMGAIGVLLVNLAEAKPAGTSWLLFLGFGAFVAVSFSLLGAARGER